MHESDYSLWMSEEYQHILSQSDKIMSDFKERPQAMNYIAGVLTDMYVDICKFRGTNVRFYIFDQEFISILMHIFQSVA